MGKLIDGKWTVQSVATNNKSGSYKRIPRSFLNWISVDHEKFIPEKDRYHLYVSLACPWAHRTLIFRELKSLQDYISVSVVSPDMLDDGWIFDELYPDSTVDHINNYKFLRDVYLKADPNISTSVTVPILWDKKSHTIVNNESSQIIRIFNSEFNHLTNNKEDYYPKSLQKDIDEINEKIYEPINNGVYKTGFATSQESYEKACNTLFENLDWLENHLENKEFLVGDQITEADIRLVTTLLRFDLVYYTHFKCNKKRLIDYKNLSRFTRSLYKIDAIKKTTNFDHIKRHYFYSHDKINPYRIVPVGPDELF